MTNSKITKRALLTSTLAVLMCISMLIGTTFAWFTDSASTAVNKIQAGTLDVDLEMKVDGEWVSAEGQTLSFVNKDGSSDILWEPGVTFRTTEFRVVNKGNLALKYKFAISGIDGDAKLNEAIEWKYEYIFENGSAASYDLSNLASAETVLKPAGTPLSDYEARGYRLVGHMKNEAGNEYQGLSIDGISITVYATQATVEYDSDTNLYDKDAEYNENAWDGTVGTLPEAVNGVITITTPQELAAFADQVNNHNNSFGGQTIMLANDLDMNNLSWLPVGQNFGANTTEFHGVFDGNGKTVSNIKIASLGEEAVKALTTNEQQVYSVGFFGYLCGTVKNLTIKNAEVIGYHNVGVIAGYGDQGTYIENCHVESSTVTVTHLTETQCGDKVGGIIGLINNNVGLSGAEIKDCSVKDTEISAGRDAGQVIGCASNEGADYENCTATNVTVSATDGCTGANINNTIIGRDLR